MDTYVSRFKLRIRFFFLDRGSMPFLETKGAYFSCNQAQTAQIFIIDKTYRTILDLSLSIYIYIVCGAPELSLILYDIAYAILIYVFLLWMMNI